LDALSDPFELRRFVDAQQPVYQKVVSELRGGHKRSHWIWFIFPQIAGLGHSPISQYYAIQSLDEARSYLAHPVLGPRLIECTQILLDLRDGSISEILGSPDDLKFRSSMTLFSQASNDGDSFRAALTKYFEGKPDSSTLSRLPHS
jgi:uncharacterized protein (DUF1810 family)